MARKKKEQTVEPFEAHLQAAIPQSTSIAPKVTAIGEVIYVGDGICKVMGLPNARIDDMIKIDSKGEEVSALILGINHDIVESVVLGDYTKISKGDVVKSTKRRVTVPVGASVEGRVINPLGKPIDGKGELGPHTTVPVEVPAPPVNEREQIKDQIRTGILVVDSIIPVGQGQRELVIGDRKAGKTTLMVNIIKNQKGQGIHCIYVAIGGKKAKVKGIIENLEQAGALAYTTIILATADDPPSLNYIAPYAGCSIAEHYMRTGQHAIVIYDDLSKHAKSYRQMSLLLKRSPGRDAYPGDIFFLHSRLLERSAKLSKECGSGSSTAFPMAETQSGDISEYITTNLMSITDGHIYLDNNLMHAGVVPAVDSGASVSRIGGSIQSKLLRKLSDTAASQLQRYNEVKSYEDINTEITAETEREIKKGKRIREIFTQASSINFSLAEEVLLLYLVTQGKLDDIEVPDVRKIKKEIINLLRTEEYKHFYELLSSTTANLDDIEEEMDFKFTPEFLLSLLQTTKPEEKEAVKLNQTGLGAGIQPGSPKNSSLTPPSNPGSSAINMQLAGGNPAPQPSPAATDATPAPSTSVPSIAAAMPTEIPTTSVATEPSPTPPVVTVAPIAASPPPPPAAPKTGTAPAIELGEVINNIPDDPQAITEITI